MTQRRAGEPDALSWTMLPLCAVVSSVSTASWALIEIVSIVECCSNNVC